MPRVLTCDETACVYYPGGSNLDAQLGTGDEDDRFEPTLIDKFKMDGALMYMGSTHVLEASCGDRHMVVVTGSTVLTVGGVVADDGLWQIDDATHWHPMQQRQRAISPGCGAVARCNGLGASYSWLLPASTNSIH